MDHVRVDNVRCPRHKRVSDLPCTGRIRHPAGHRQAQELSGVAEPLASPVCGIDHRHDQNVMAPGSELMGEIDDLPLSATYTQACDDQCDSAQALISVTDSRAQSTQATRSAVRVRMGN